MMFIKRIINKFFPKRKTPLDFYNLSVGFLGEKVVSSSEWMSAAFINNLYFKLTGKIIGGELSTYELNWFLENDKRRFSKELFALPGDIIISPTGTAKNIEAIGNVGIVGYDSQVFSINTASGKFDNHFTLDMWRDKYVTQGFPVNFFRIK